MKTLIIGKVWPEPCSSAAGRRMQQIIQMLLQKGEVHFACASAKTGNEVDIEKWGVHTKTICINDDAVNEYFFHLNPDVVIFDRFMVEEQYGWRIIEQCPQALRVLNTEDLHFLRKTRHQWVQKTQAIASDVKELDFRNDEMVRELAAIFRCDWTWLVSPFEMDLLSQEMHVPQEKLFYLPLFYETQPIEQNQAAKDFLFIGNFMHEPNADAVRMLVEGGIWERIRQALPEATLKIVGAYPKQHFLNYSNHQKGIEVLGHAKKIETIYAHTRVAVMPLRFGAGVKGKVLESLSYGVPFISTQMGTEGLFLDTLLTHCEAQNWDEFVAKAIVLYQNDTVRNEFVEKGNKILQQHYSPTVWNERFVKALEQQVETYQVRREKQYFSYMLQHQSLMSMRYLSKWIMEKNKM